MPTKTLLELATTDGKARSTALQSDDYIAGHDTSEAESVAWTGAAIGATAVSAFSASARGTELDSATAGVAANASDIDDLETLTATNAGDIATNADAIVSLESDVSDNTGLINQKAQAFRAPVNETSTARTLTDSDNGKVIFCSHVSGCSITVPADTLTSGFQCDVVCSVSGGGATINVSSTGTPTPSGILGQSIAAGEAMSISALFGTTLVVIGPLA